MRGGEASGFTCTHGFRIGVTDTVPKPQIANCHIFGRSTNLKKLKSVNLQICDLRDFFANHPPLFDIGLTKCKRQYNENILSYFPLHIKMTYCYFTDRKIPMKLP
jgi:hypothetical protein